MKRAFFFLFLLAGLSAFHSVKAQPSAEQKSVTVYYFHATMRCATCNAVEEQTRKVVDENFAAELKSGVLKLEVLNFEDKENRDLAKQFEIGWSSLILFVPGTKEKVDMTETAFANARTHPEEFRAELEKQIKGLL
jgi:thiol-disulfide isomerase/thioredoxin